MVMTAFLPVSFILYPVPRNPHLQTTHEAPFVPMQQNTPMDHYAVMGNPIQHSKSPAIHARFAQQTAQPLHYDAILVALDGFSAAVEQFQGEGGKGLNITVPFKQEAWQLADTLSERARHAGAVNTLVFLEDGTRHGDNTDGVGLVRDLTRNHQMPLRDQQILILGAGGAVRGVIAPLMEQQPASLTIANRTASRAQELATHFADLGAIGGCGFEALQGRQFDLIINGTSASLQGEVPPLPPQVLKPGGSCYDMMYASKPTAFVEWGMDHGAGQSVDGLGMLVEQAAESFFLWRQVRPETGPVIDALREELASA